MSIGAGSSKLSSFRSLPQIPRTQVLLNVCSNPVVRIEMISMHENGLLEPFRGNVNQHIKFLIFITCFLELLFKFTDFRFPLNVYGRVQLMFLVLKTDGRGACPGDSRFGLHPLGFSN